MASSTLHGCGQHCTMLLLTPHTLTEAAAPAPLRLYRFKPAPVYTLRKQHNVTDIRMKLAASEPPLLFPYTNPAHDVDVSAQMEGEGGVELGETKLVGGPARLVGLLGGSKAGGAAWQQQGCCVGR
jgi:hypothetical protein